MILAKTLLLEVIKMCKTSLLARLFILIQYLISCVFEISIVADVSWKLGSSWSFLQPLFSFNTLNLSFYAFVLLENIEI